MRVEHVVSVIRLQHACQLFELVDCLPWRPFEHFGPRSQQVQLYLFQGMRDEVVFLIVEDGKDAHFSFRDDGPAVDTLDALQLSQLQVVLDDHLLETDRADLGLDVGATSRQICRRSWILL